MWTYWDFNPLMKLAAFALACFLAVYLSNNRQSLLRRFKRTATQLSLRPWLCAAIIFGLSLSLNATLSLVRWPAPRVHDEFSYLLASDTFAEGRLTNQVHPLGEHFESFHVLSSPSVTAKYPPANSAFMAIGQVLTGYPIVGIWLALALACTAIYWMFRAWTSAYWAMLGGFLVTIHSPILHAWGQSYWGGAAAFLGGALVFGGLRRIYQSGLARDSLLLGTGLVLLSNSRPMEGFLISLPVLAMALWWMFRPAQKLANSTSLRLRVLKIAVPLLLIGAVGIGVLGTYNRAVTGSVAKLPYHAHDDTYLGFSMLIWKDSVDAVPAYNHRRMEEYFLSFRNRQKDLRSLDNYLPDLGRRLGLLWKFYPLGLGLLVVAIPALWRNNWYRFALVITAGLLLIHTQLITSWIFPHYLAPIAALFFLLSVVALRNISLWQRERKIGKNVVRAVVVFSMLKLVLLYATYQTQMPMSPRQFVETTLEAKPAKDLVIVSYAPDYSVHKEWVYNKASIDTAGVVFARDLGHIKNAELIDYFSGRKIWRWHLENEQETNLQECDSQGNPTLKLTAGR